MNTNTRRAFILFVAILLAAIVAVVLLAATAHSAQCGCPPAPEPPVVVSPLRTPVPWTGRVWLVWVQGGAE